MSGAFDDVEDGEVVEPDLDVRYMPRHSMQDEDHSIRVTDDGASGFGSSSSSSSSSSAFSSSSSSSSSLFVSQAQPVVPAPSLSRPFSDVIPIEQTVELDTSNHMWPDEVLRSLPAMEPRGLRGGVSLSRYQKQGLYWLHSRENLQPYLPSKDNEYFLWDVDSKTKEWNLNAAVKKGAITRETATKWIKASVVKEGPLAGTMDVCSRAGILGDAPGLGKTLQFISLITTDFLNDTQGKPVASCGSHRTVFLSLLSVVRQIQGEFEGKVDPSLFFDSSGLDSYEQKLVAGTLSSPKIMLCNLADLPGAAADIPRLCKWPWTVFLCNPTGFLKKKFAEKMIEVAKSSQGADYFRRLIMDEAHHDHYGTKGQLMTLIAENSSLFLCRWVSTGTPIVNGVTGMMHLLYTAGVFPFGNSFTRDECTVWWTTMLTTKSSTGGKRSKQRSNPGADESDAEKERRQFVKERMRHVYLGRFADSKVEGKEPPFQDAVPLHPLVEGRIEVDISSFEFSFNCLDKIENTGSVSAPVAELKYTPKKTSLALQYSRIIKNAGARDETTLLLENPTLDIQGPLSLLLCDPERFCLVYNVACRDEFDLFVGREDARILGMSDPKKVEYCPGTFKTRRSSEGKLIRTFKHQEMSHDFISEISLDLPVVAACDGPLFWKKRLLYSGRSIEYQHPVPFTRPGKREEHISSIPPKCQAIWSEIAKTDEKILLFCINTLVLSSLYQVLTAHGIVTYASSSDFSGKFNRDVDERLIREKIFTEGTRPYDDLREQVAWLFKNDPGARVFLSTIATAGTGLNFTEATTVMFAQVSWSAAEVQQCIARSRRRGQTKPVRALYFVCVPRTFEENRMSTVIRKRNLVKQVFFPGQNNQAVEIAVEEPEGRRSLPLLSSGEPHVKESEKYVNLLKGLPGMTEFANQLRLEMQRAISHRPPVPGGEKKASSRTADEARMLRAMSAARQYARSASAVSTEPLPKAFTPANFRRALQEKKAEEVRQDLEAQMDHAHVIPELRKTVMDQYDKLGADEVDVRAFAFFFKALLRLSRRRYMRGALRETAQVNERMMASQELYQKYNSWIITGNRAIPDEINTATELLSRVDKTIEKVQSAWNKLSGKLPPSDYVDEYAPELPAVAELTDRVRGLVMAMLLERIMAEPQLYVDEEEKAREQEAEEDEAIVIDDEEAEGGDSVATAGPASSSSSSSSSPSSSSSSSSAAVKRPKLTTKQFAEKFGPACSAIWNITAASSGFYDWVQFVSPRILVVVLSWIAPGKMGKDVQRIADRICGALPLAGRLFVFFHRCTLLGIPVKVDMFKTTIYYKKPDDELISDNYIRDQLARLVHAFGYRKGVE